MNVHAPNIEADVPANIEAEQALLGAILIDPSALPLVGWQLQGWHFSEAIHQKIFETCREMAASGLRPSVVTLKDFLPYSQIIGESDLGTYIARLASNAVGSTAVEGYARAIIDLAMRRDLIDLAGDIRDAAVNTMPGQSPRAQIEAAVQRLSELSAAGLRRHQRQGSAGQAADELLADLESGKPKERPISTGFVDLDRLIGGYRRGNLIIGAGRPGMGKSMFAGCSAVSVSAKGHGVLFFSLEMTKEELVARMLTDIAYRNSEPVTFDRILNRDQLREDQYQGLREARVRLKQMPLIVDPQQGMTIHEIAVRTRRVAESMARRGVTLALVVIDHLHKVALPHGRDGRHVELGDVTTAAAELAKEVDAGVFVLSQLNRQVEGRDNKRPQLADLRESGRIEEDADVVLGFYREAYYLSRQREADAEKEVKRSDRLQDVQYDLDASVLKNRHGADGMAKLWVHAGCAAIRDRDQWSR